MSCPFYGHAIAFVNGTHPVMMDTGGNQCALMTGAHSPCRMEIQGARPNWAECDRNPENNGSGFDAVITRTMTQEEARRRWPGAFDAQEKREEARRRFPGAFDAQESEP